MYNGWPEVYMYFRTTMASKETTVKTIKFGAVALMIATALVTGFASVADAQQRGNNNTRIYAPRTVTNNYGGGYYGGGGGYGYNNGYNNGMGTGAILGGLGGLAAGVIIGQATAPKYPPPQPAYYPPPQYAYQPQPVVVGPPVQTYNPSIPLECVDILKETVNGIPRYNRYCR